MRQQEIDIFLVQNFYEKVNWCEVTKHSLSKTDVRYFMAFHGVLSYWFTCSLNYYAVVPANQTFLAIFTLVFTSSPFIPMNVMSYLFLVRGSWTSPFAITGEPGMAGNSTSIPYLLYRYWWNTRIFPFTKKSYLHRAQWRYYFYLSRVRILR